MKLEDAVVGTRVRSKVDFATVDAGTEGVIDEDYGAGIMVAWDLEDRPLPQDYLERSEDNLRPTTIGPDGFPVPISRDGFGKEHELEFLEVVGGIFTQCPGCGWSWRYTGEKSEGESTACPRCQRGGIEIGGSL